MNFRKLFGYRVKFAFLIIISLLQNSCSWKNKFVGQSQHSYNIDTLAVKPTLLKYLTSYIETYDTIRVSWRVSPIYLVSFYLDKRDTLVYINGHKICPLITVDSEFNDGGFMTFKDRQVLIVDTPDSIGRSLYIKKNLQKNVELVGKGRDVADYERFTLPTWIYKISDKVNIQLIREEKSHVLK